MTEERWRAIVACDGRYDGQFVYGVTTTGVFCRPSCRSKTPVRRNVVVFASPGEALDRGFRPCKRCRPDRASVPTPGGDLVFAAVHLLEDHFAEELSLREVAARLYVSPFHLHRLFRRALNLSPAQYLLRRRIEAAKTLLRESDLSITAIALNVGFKSPAHFSAVFRRETGSRPSAYRALLEPR